MPVSTSLPIYHPRKCSLVLTAKAQEVCHLLTIQLDRVAAMVGGKHLNRRDLAHVEDFNWSSFSSY